MKNFSICIPAYNRFKELDDLLDSIVKEEYQDYEIVIAEDDSPEREKISKVVQKYKNLYPNIIIKYSENEYNFGYDKNYRRLIDMSEGKYCFFMGNDDLVYSGGLKSAANILDKYKNVGVVIRTYATFFKETKKIEEVFRYSKNELYLPPSPSSIAFAFRRSVVMSGMIYERESAKNLHHDMFDGTLLYQLYLVSKILEKKHVVLNPDITVLVRTGGIPDFGNSKIEKSKFTPRKQSPESSINFVKGMLDIARYAGKENKKIFQLISNDISCYSYPIISIQANRKKGKFLKYIFSLIKLGLGKNILFYIYVFVLLFFGKNITDYFIKICKRTIGYTPRFFNFI